MGLGFLRFKEGGARVLEGAHSPPKVPFSKLLMLKALIPVIMSLPLTVSVGAMVLLTSP